MSPRSVKVVPAPPRPSDFEFCIEGPALSARAKNKTRLRDWTARVSAAAKAAWPKRRPPMAGEVDVYIGEFSEVATTDRDNLAKPVLDAMQGIAYENDSQVKGLHVEWCDIEGSYVVRFMSPILAKALTIGREFLWVRVSRHVPRQDMIR
jgi:crossover junction endodeoxyribonuclease RusA